MVTAAVWTFDGRLRKADVQIGASDGSFTELVGADGLTEGTKVATRVTQPGDTRPAGAAPGSNPLMGQTPRRF